MTGIYRIKNIVNDKCYYGSSKDIKIRFKQHKDKLNNKTHINIILQRAWNKYGEINFLFECIEECKYENLFEVEQKYLDLNPAYNIGKNSSGGDNLTDNPNRLDIIKRIKESSILRGQNMTSEERELFSKPGDLNPNWKGGISKKTCRCGNRMNYASTMCNDCDDRSGEKNTFYGKTHSEETRKKLSDAKKGKETNHSNLIFYIDNIEYRTLKQASDKLNIHITTIQHRLYSKNYKYKEYRYKGINKVYYTLEEQKEKQKSKQKGKELNLTNKVFFIDDIEYRTLKEAFDKLNINQATISSRLRNDNFPNYRYK